MKKNIGIFYGPQKGSTAEVANLIHKEIGVDKADIHPIANINPEEFYNYDYLICGLPTVGNDTWNSNHPGNLWNTIVKSLRKEKLTGKKIAIFGLGNQITYPNNFIEDVKMLADKFTELGAELFGEWSTEGYDFKFSKAVTGDKFIGLAIDEDTQAELTAERVKSWVNNLKNVISGS